jgi:hypothetical protein
MGRTRAQITARPFKFEGTSCGAFFLMSFLFLVLIFLLCRPLSKHFKKTSRSVLDIFAVFFPLTLVAFLPGLFLRGKQNALAKEEFKRLLILKLSP